MDSELLKLVIPLGLVAIGFYLKSAKYIETNAPKNLWITLIIVGLIGFILRLMLFLIK
ncbi:MAG TPA: hypothetical protein VLZ11_08965 [Flavobacterium sp.]|nr:hypothetical protein [Flavobacterium sp.]